MILHLFPTAITLDGISSTTTDPAPMILQLPISIPCFITEPAPIQLPSPTDTFPDNTAPGDMWTKSDILHS